MGEEEQSKMRRLSLLDVARAQRLHRGSEFFLLGRQLCGRNRQPCTGCSVGGAGPMRLPCRVQRVRGGQEAAVAAKPSTRAVPMLVRLDRNRLDRTASGTDARTWAVVTIAEFGGFCCKKCHAAFLRGSPSQHGTRCHRRIAENSVPRVDPVA